ncbi:MAG: toprim domain-containing protein [Verrucomicrobiae bacterium]|nr:toprim domain-containing protein [Verrucomicrobiae bacterium]
MSFTRVSKSHPCPVCKKPDWCRVFGDGWVECMRVQSDRPAKSGGWMHSQRELSPGRLTPRAPRSAPPPTINATKLMRDWLAATTLTALAEFAASLGVSTPSLVAVGAAWAAPHSAWAFPMCDGYGNVVGIRLRNERGKFAVRGSRQGIFLCTCERIAPAGIQQVEHAQSVANQANQSLQPTDSGGLSVAVSAIGSQSRTLFVCEGPTDTAAAIELGLFAVGRPNCCCGGAEIKVFARRHDCRRVVIISDNDKPGLDGARKVGGELKLPFAVYVPPAKDVREFVRLGGTRAMIESTLNNTIWNT